MTDDDYKKVSELMGLCKTVRIFECEGVLFYGDTVKAAKTYVDLNPSKPFFIWLQDNYTQVK